MHYSADFKNVPTIPHNLSERPPLYLGLVFRKAYPRWMVRYPEVVGMITLEYAERNRPSDFEGKA